MVAPLPYRDLNSYLRDRFGARVQKITLDAGLTCPNRDGRVGRGGCLYCNAQGSGSGAWARGLGVGQQVEQGISYLSRRYGAARFIAYFQSFSNTYEQQLHLEAELQTRAGHTEDFNEGVNAFFEKRPPVFKGR